MTVAFEKSPYWSHTRDEISNRDEPILAWDEIARPVLDYWFSQGARRILDAGCGTGHVVGELTESGWNAEGITYQPPEVAEFRRRRPELSSAVQLGDLHALPYPVATFDVTLCWDVLEHTLAPLHVLGEMRRVTRTGGGLVLFIPGQMWQECKYHIIVPTIRQTTHLLFLSGWHVETIYDLSQVQDQAAIYVCLNTPSAGEYEAKGFNVTRDILYPPHGTAVRPIANDR